MHAIQLLLKDLQSVPATESVENPYHFPECRVNLASFLDALLSFPYSGHLLIGEALGYRGGALTGIPFSSQRIFRSHPHPFWEKLRASLVVTGDVSEPTATIVWSHLLHCSVVPAFWNVFPFHPHKFNANASNRAPKRNEIVAGRPFLDQIIDILSPHTLIAVGRVAERAITCWYPEMKLLVVRHPSHGGKKAFVASLTAAGIV